MPGGDHRLGADHPAHLAPAHPDRAQHPELARALVHGQRERVDDAEQGHDHRQQQQAVDEAEQLVDLRRSGCP